MRPLQIGTIFLAGLLTATGSFGQSANPVSGPIPSSNGELMWNRIGQAAIDPTTGNTLPYGYFTVMNGVPLPLFTNYPTESTAFFTFVYQPFGATALPQDLDQIPFLAKAATFDIYLNTKASKRSWSDPATFAQGIKVATYARTPFQGEQIVNIQYQHYSAALIYSQPFTVNGVTLNFANIAPGLTIYDYLGVVPGSGFNSTYSAAYSLSGYALVTHYTPSGHVTAALAGPANASVVTSEFRLDGSRSTSAAGTALKYEWSLAPGSPLAKIEHPESPTPVVRFGNTKGTYIFRLSVTDEDGNSSSDFTTVKFAGKETM